MGSDAYAETIIVGGGQAGLSVARYLKEKGRPFLILEKSSYIGQSWAERYDSLVLDSFAKYSSLEGFPFPGDKLRHPKKHEVVEYLQSFSKNFGLNLEFNTEVLKIEKEKDKFKIETTKGIFAADNIVLATGVFQKPFLPNIAKEIPENIFQIHSRNYKNPAQIPPGKILVVGNGNSGVEIVEELANAGREVYFSFRRKLKSVQSTPFSQWMAYTLGLAHVPKHTLLGKLIIWYTKGKSVGMSVKDLLSNPHVTEVGECTGVQGDKIVCTKKEVNDVKAVVWATGYETDFSTISILDFDPEKEKRGITNIPGLYILNKRWQYAKSSSHLAGVSRDAKYIANDIIQKYGKPGTKGN